MTQREIDWESIRVEYRAGQQSVRAIAVQHGLTEGAIRKRAKRDGWRRDLTKLVRARTKEKLVRTRMVRSDNLFRTGEAMRTIDVPEIEEKLPSTDLIEPKVATREDEIIEFASDRAAAVIKKHRDRISEYQVVCDMLLGRLRGLQDHIIDIEVFLEAVRNEDNARAVDSLWKALSLSEQARTINQLVQAFTKLIEAERKAFNLDDVTGNEDAPSRIIIQMQAPVGVRPIEEF